MDQMQVKKEVSVAVIIGLIIGGLIIGGIYRAKVALDNRKNNLAARTENTPAPKNNPASDSPSQIPLSITTPLDNSVVNEATTELAGTTKPGTYITILTEKNEYIIVPDEKGLFSQKINLVKGANNIIVTCYTPTGDKSELKLNVVYTTAQL